MPGRCILCGRRGPIGHFNPMLPVNERKAFVHFCHGGHERLWMTERNQLDHVDVKAIEGCLPELGRALHGMGVLDKPFSAMTKDEMCGTLAHMLRAWRDALDRLNEDGEIPF